MSILTTKFTGVYDTAPFSQIKNEDFEPSIDFAIKKAKEEIDQITNNSEAPTFENTIEALEYSGQLLNRITSIFFNLNSAETNDELQQIAQIVSPKISAHSNDIALNEKLFERIKTVFDQKNQWNLTAEQNTLLDNTYKFFVRNGALLPNEKKERFREITKEMTLLSLKFGENVLNETNNYQLHITDEKDVLGIPKDTLETAKLLAEKEHKEGWIFTLDFPSYNAVLTYAENRELRKEMAIAYGKRGFQSNECNNENTIIKLVQLRHEKAQLLGYKTFADFILEERMAESSSRVVDFLQDLLSKAKPAAERELNELTIFANKTNGISKLEKWDGAFYSEKLKKQKFNIDDEILKPYFQLENVLEGAFTVANKLFHLSFEETNTIDKYHPDVKTYVVKDKNNELKAVFYADFFPRKGKRNGAWMTSFKPQYIQNNINERPHISIVCNFTKPTSNKPSLLTFNEVTTLFHEFGHALHGILANTTYASLSGTSVYWDFVELPSQILENWCYEEESLKLFAKHYQTGEIIPMELVEKIKESANFLQGMATVRQLSFGLLDMGWHNTNPEKIDNLKQFENEQIKETKLFPDVEENAISPAFSHIFQGGYSAGYYSYKWAEVLDADAFAYFQEKGIFNQEIAKKFEEFILSKGGTEHPMQLYKKFRGAEPQPNALLKRAGLI